ncbi:MAG: DUF3810 domain-containing protein [Oscillospiraceae bacterium]|nr:DUF3810 domain-containing protein [Oscillospiraceae bacterium]
MKKSLIFLTVTVLLNIMIWITSRLSVSFSEWYAANVYPFFVNAVACVFGIFPFSAAEILLMALIAATIAGAVFLVVKLVKSKGKRGRVLLKTTVYVSCAASVALLVFLLNCGINYNREPFLRGEGYEFSEYTRVQMWTVYLTALDEFCEIIPLVSVDESGGFALTGDLNKTAPAALRAAAEKYPRLDVYYPRPKPVLNSGLMSDARIIGIFSPFTIEANYNGIVPDSQKPAAVCHELAHLAGFMKEEEANFIAFVACRESGEPDFMYSGYLKLLDYMAWDVPPMDGYFYDSLPDYTRGLLERHITRLDSETRADFEEYGYLNAYALLPEQAAEDLRRQNEFWWWRSREIVYEVGEDGEVVEVITSNPLSEFIGDISGDINDGYLKAQGQGDGAASYRRMTDLVMAEYLKEITERNAV